MYSRISLARKYIAYYFGALNGKGHGIHSPFVYDLVTRVLNDTREYPDYAAVEALRRRLLGDRTVIGIDDLGAGSAAEKREHGNESARGAMKSGSAEERNRRIVADIARNAAKPKKLGQLLFRIVAHYKPQTMLELGTSLGLSAAYLGAGAAQGEREGAERIAGPDASDVEGRSNESGGNRSKFITIEGAAEVAKLAEKNFAALGLENIEVMRGAFDDRLPEALGRLGSIDLVFVDGNHRREPTLTYFNLLLPKMSASSVMIFDDIHWSKEMEEVWEAIRRDGRVMLTIDLFFIGLVFFREEFKVKQDFVIRY